MKEPSEEHKNLREELIKTNNFVDKLGKGDRLECRPISLEVDQRKLAHMKPVNQVKPFGVPFHIRKAYEREISDMLEAGIIVPCEGPTDWNTKAFPVVKSDGMNIRLVGDFIGLNSVFKKLFVRVARMHSAAYIIFIMWNSISGLDT